MNDSGMRDAPNRLHELVISIRESVTEMDRLVSLIGVGQGPSPAAEQFLSLTELCARIPYKEQTIRNLMNTGELTKEVHFLQRKRHGKIVFIWSTMELWLRERQLDRSLVEPFIPAHHARTRKVR